MELADLVVEVGEGASIAETLIRRVPVAEGARPVNIFEWPEKGQMTCVRQTNKRVLESIKVKSITGTISPQFAGKSVLQVLRENASHPTLLRTAAAFENGNVHVIDIAAVNPRMQLTRMVRSTDWGVNFDGSLTWLLLGALVPGGSLRNVEAVINEIDTPLMDALATYQQHCAKNFPYRDMARVKVYRHHSQRVKTFRAVHDYYDLHVVADFSSYPRQGRILDLNRDQFVQVIRDGSNPWMFSRLGVRVWE